MTGPAVLLPVTMSVRMGKFCVYVPNQTAYLFRFRQPPPTEEHDKAGSSAGDNNGENR